MLDFLSYRYIYALGQLFVLFDVVITSIIFIPIVVIYLYLDTFFCNIVKHLENS